MAIILIRMVYYFGNSRSTTSGVFAFLRTEHRALGD
jgi:hypothetical protein